MTVLFTLLYKLTTLHLKYDLCKYNFTVRVISLWNSLPTHVVTADSVDSFKNRLDKFWANEEARFDYKANLSFCSVSALVIHYEEALYQVYVCTFIWQRFCEMLLNLMLRFCYYAL